MAKSLAERLKAALSPRARVSDNEDLLADLKAEQERLEVARDAAASESVDFALSEDDRDEAAAKAARLDRTIRALETEISRLTVLIEERRDSDARKAVEAEKRAALTERDEIAAQFAKRVPEITAELIELFEAVNANAERMRLADVREANAEFHARGIGRNGMAGVSQPQPFLKMKIPEFNGAGRVWPIEQPAYVSNYRELKMKAIEDAQEKAQAEAEAAKKFAREHGRYRLTVEMAPNDPERLVRIPDELVRGNIPATLGCWDSRELVISHDIAAGLKKVTGLMVERLDQEAAQ